MKATILAGMLMVLLSVSFSVSAAFSSHGPLLIDFSFNRLVVAEGGTARFPFTLSSGFSVDEFDSNSSRVIEVDLTQQSIPQEFSCWFEDSNGKNVGGVLLDAGESVNLFFSCRVNKFKRNVIQLKASFVYTHFNPKYYNSVSLPSTVFRTVYLLKPDSDLVDVEMEDGGVYTTGSIVKVKGTLKSVSGGSYDMRLLEAPGWSSSITDENGVPLYRVKVDSDVKKVFYVNLLPGINASPGVHNFTLALGDSNISFSILLGSPSHMVDASVDYDGKVINAGDDVEFTISLSNLGSSNTCKVYVTNLPADWSYSILSNKEERLSKVFLDSGAKTLVSVKFTTPSNENAGEYLPQLVLESDAFNKSLPLSVSVLQDKKPYDLELSSSYPQKNAIVGRSIDYPFRVNNTGINKDVYALSVSGMPDGWSYRFKESSSGSSLSSVEISSSSGKDLTLQLNPSPDAELREYPFTIQASSRNANKNLNVSLILEGSYNANLKIDNLYMVVDAGVEGKVQVKVENTGSKELRSIELDAVKPDGWDVTVMPAKISILQPQSTSTFTLLIKSPPDTGIGDYMLKVKAKTAETETKEESIRVTVNRTSVMGYIGIALIALALGGLYVVFKRSRK